MNTLPAGTIKRLHVDRRRVAADGKAGTRSAVITVQTSRGPIKAHSVEIKGPSRFVYRPDKPLSCGAKAWIETTAEIAIDAPAT